MSKEFLFLSGRISALESKLITFSQLERMVMAETPEAAFRILVELQYADLFNDSTKAEDFLNIIYQGLLETKKMIVEGTDEDQSLEFIWKNFDLNNLKRALKLKLIEGESVIQNFSEENGFDLLGSISQKDISSAVFDGKMDLNFPTEYKNIIDKSDDIFGQNNEFSDLEFALDKAHFSFLKRISKDEGLDFLTSWLEKMSDTTNIKTLARNIFVFNKDFTKEIFLPYGKIKFDDFKNVKSISDFDKFFNGNDLFSFVGVLNENKSEKENILNIERATEKYIDSFLQESESNSLGGIEVPLVYLHKRIKSARKIKFVMFSKFYEIEPEKIYESLKHI